MIKQTASVLLLLSLWGCGGGSGEPDNGANPPSTNQAPAADAGADQTIAVASMAQLFGTSSSDPEGDPISYRWRLIATPANSGATLGDANTVSPFFTADLAGRYEVELIVNDGLQDSRADTIIITATNTAPVAGIGVPYGQQSSDTGSTISIIPLNSYDDNGDPLSFNWSIISQPANSTTTLDTSDPERPRLFLDEDGEYTIQLIVSDGSSDSLPVTVTVTATHYNTPPAAHAGPDQRVVTNTRVQLDGSASGDTDSNAITLAWRISSAPNQSTAQLSNPTTASPSFSPDKDGDYTVELIVSDLEQAQTTDTLTITAFTPDSRPVAVAGSDFIVSSGDTIDLDASASFDPNNASTSLSYRWQLDSKPLNSTATLAGDASVNPQLNTDLVGEYTLSLVVNNGIEESLPAHITVTAYLNTGTLDSSFASGGLASIYGAIPSLVDTQSHAMALDSNNNSYLLGKSYNGIGLNVSISPGVWKFNSAGQLDNSFNGTGMVLNTTASVDWNDVATDASGAVYITGTSSTGGRYDMTLWKYKPDGTLDTGFNGTGSVFHNAGAGTAGSAGYAIKIDSTGKLWVVGHIKQSDATNRMTLWKYNPDGTLDTSFNSTGFATFNALSDTSFGIAMTIGPDGSLYVTGQIMTENNDFDMAVWKYSSSGSPDTSFNSTGYFSHNLSSEGNRNYDLGKSIALDSQGNIIVGGYFAGLLDDAVIWRLTPEGALDTTFDDDGYVIYNYKINGRLGLVSSSDKIYAITVDSDDSIYAIGDNTSTQFSLMILKYDNSGQLDTTFNHTGHILLSDHGGGDNFTARAAVLDGESNLYAAGNARFDHRDVLLLKIK